MKRWNNLSRKWQSGFEPSSLGFSSIILLKGRRKPNFACLPLSQLVIIQMEPRGPRLNQPSEGLQHTNNDPQRLLMYHVSVWVFEPLRNVPGLPALSQVFWAISNSLSTPATGELLFYYLTGTVNTRPKCLVRVFPRAPCWANLTGNFQPGLRDQFTHACGSQFYLWAQHLLRESVSTT